MMHFSIVQLLYRQTCGSSDFILALTDKSENPSCDSDQPGILGITLWKDDWVRKGYRTNTENKFILVNFHVSDIRVGPLGFLPPKWVIYKFILLEAQSAGFSPVLTCLYLGELPL